MKKAVVAIVKHEGQILVGKKVSGKGYLAGKWHILGETLEEGESDEEGLKRGVMEEAGIKIHVLGLLASSKTPKHTSVNWYECEPLTFNIKAGSDLEEVRWMSKAEAKSMCSDEAKSLWPREVKDYLGQESS